MKLVHGFRALYAHRLRERGAPLDAIKNLLGHSDIKVTEGYFPASQTRERAAAALLDALTSDRPYHPGVPLADALREIQPQAGRASTRTSSPSRDQMARPRPRI